MQDTSAKQFLHAVPSAQSRLLIDMVNGLDVSRDHLRVARSTEKSLAARLAAVVSGSTQRHGHMAAQSQQLVLDSVVKTVTALAQGQAGSNWAIAAVADRLSEVEASLASAVHVLADTRDAVHQLSSTVNEQARRFSGDIARIDLRAAASEQMEHVFSRWEAGAFEPFPAASRAFIALHELHWGSFGAYLHHHPLASNASILLETLSNRLLGRLKQHGLGDGNAFPLTLWLARPPVKDDVDSEFFIQALAYLGSNTSARSNPWTYTLTHLPLPADTPNEVARYCSPQVLAQRLSREFFPAMRGIAHA